MDQLAAAIIALGLATGSKSEDPGPSTSEAQPARWQRPEIVLWLDKTTPRRIPRSDLYGVLAAAAAAWRRAGCGAPRIRIAGFVDKRQTEKDGTSLVVFREDAWCRNGDPRDGCHDPDDVAVTFVHARREDLVEADIAVNGIQYRWAALRGDGDARGRDHLDPAECAHA